MASEPQSASPHLPSWREPKRKALLIGINGTLRGPQRDVAEMNTLLITKYGYKEQDIQILVDDGVADHVQPNRTNIMRGITSLVNDTRPGDKLFFLYCGHSIQVPTRSDTEEDGLDECIVPLEGEEHVIKDNELRARLVDPLPSGALLVAVFDSCHSATLLDLEHLRCNRVFVPWLSRSKRQSDEMRNKIARRLALPIISPSSTSPLSQSPIRTRSRRASIESTCSPILSPRSPSRSPISAPSATILEDASLRTTRRSSVSHRALLHRSRIPAPLQLWKSNKENLLANVGEDNLYTNGSAGENGGSLSSRLWDTGTSETLVHSALPWTGTGTGIGVLCESPEPAYCQGWCRVSKDNALFSATSFSPVSEHKLADVISLAACKDSELSWETDEGVSMTQALVQVLSEDPHPTLRDMVTRISHTLHELARKRHSKASAWKSWRRANAIKSSGLGSFDTASFQHPQLSSHVPLDLDKRWDL